ncbi:MAG: hypothetical protein HC854_11600 [Flavobacterium sp.]|nr:hypothetical protein [Flavobacterium sp.]
MEKVVYNNDDFISNYNYQKNISTLNQKYYFENIEFVEQFDNNIHLTIFLMKTVEDEQIIFKNCLFKEDFIFKNTFSNREIIFDECKFLKEFNVSSTKFKQNVKFWDCTLSKANFNNTRFEKLADFWSTRFISTTIFYKTDFLGTTVFSSATFFKPVLFTYTLFEKDALFRGTYFFEGLDISQAIKRGKFTFFDVTIKPFRSIKNTLDNEVYESYIRDKGIIPIINKRETFRIIKQAYENSSNFIDSVEFKKREHITFLKENISNIFSGIKILPSIQNIILLFLNLISNYFGVSWFVSLLFIFFFGGLFFLNSIIQIPGYQFTMNYNEWQWDNFKYFFEFLNPTHKVEYIQKEKPK